MLWESSRDDPVQAQARLDAVRTISEVLGQASMWQAAERMRAQA